MDELSLVSWPIRLLIACFCVPVALAAQAPPAEYTVSVRELHIPPKALLAFRQGLQRQAKKDAAGSLPFFQRAIAEYAGYFEAYDRIGVADLDLWRVADAEQAFRKAIDLSGGQYAHPLIALGAILDDHETFAEAEQVLRKGLNLDPHSWRAQYYLGEALFGLNRVAEAEQIVCEALRSKADFPQAYLLLADIHQRTQDYPSLLADLNAYLALAPDGSSSAKAKSLRESVRTRMGESESSAALAEP